MPSAKRRKLFPLVLTLSLALSGLIVGLLGEAFGDKLQEFFTPMLPHWKWILGGVVIINIIVAVWDRWHTDTPDDTPPPTPLNHGNVNIGGNVMNSPITTGDHNEVNQPQGDVVKGDKHIHNYAPQSAIHNPQSAINPLHQLPAAPDLVGRDDEIHELLDKLKDGGVTISASVQGQGGVGKTALALVLANRLRAKYPDAQFFLDLQGVTNPLTPAQAMAHVIRAYHPEAKLPDDEAALGNLYRSVLHDKKALLVWDNARDKAQIEPLRPPEGCVMIVTSRQKFILPWLHAKALEVLPPDQSIALLLRHAARIGEAADKIAELCGGLPFALMLAASAIAESPNLTVAKYVERLTTQRLKTLDGVAASLRLSYELLSETQQLRWRALSVFPATFNEKAVVAIWQSEADAANTELSALIKLSLLEFDTQTQRYRLHDLAREFAHECTNDSERACFSLRYAAHYCELLRKAGELYLQGGTKFAQGLSLYDQEHKNIQAGQAWAAAHSNCDGDETAARLCMDYARWKGANFVLTLRLPPRERIHWLEAQLTAARILRLSKHEGIALGNIGNAYNDLGEAYKAIEFHEQALVIQRKIGNREGESAVLCNLGIAWAKLGEPRKAIEFYEQSLVIQHENDDRRGKGISLGNIGNAYKQLGAPYKAIEYYEQALEVARNIGDLVNEGAWLGNMGSVWKNLGEPCKAITFYNQQLIIARQIGDRRGEGTALWNLSLSLDKIGKRAEAIANAEAALRISEKIEDSYAEKGRRKLAEWRGE